MMGHWMIDLRTTSVKKCAKWARATSSLTLFSKKKKQLKKVRKLANVQVCDVSGKKFAARIAKHIAAYLNHHPDGTLWVVSRSKKLKKRCQKWQAHSPEAEIIFLKKMPAQLPKAAACFEAESKEQQTMVFELLAETSTKETIDPTEAAQEPIIETTATEPIETTEAAPEPIIETTATEPIETTETTPEPIVEISATEAIETTEATPEPIVEITATESIETTEAAPEPIVETTATEPIETTEAAPEPIVETTATEPIETETTETAVESVDTTLATAQLIIKKNKPKKKQDFIRLLMQTLHLDTASAHHVLQQLQAAGNIKLDAAENIKYFS